MPRCLIASIVLLLVWPAVEVRAAVELVTLPPSTNYPDAAAPEALAFACSESASDLPPFFAERGLPFNAALVRDREGRACHVFYEPTLQGFRASRENETAEGLYSSINPYSFLANSEIPGDSLEIVKEILSRISRSLDIRLTVSGGFSKSLWEPAAVRHFAGLPHRFSFFQSVDSIAHPWAQDHVTAGHVNGLPRTLIPHRLYEESEGNGEITEGLLQSLEAQGFVRSNLSWHGGALQFIADPRETSKTILVAGGDIHYWGAELTDDEYSYILRVEFGADEVLKLDASLPANRLIAFLPQQNTVLVSRMLRGEVDVARAAAFQLLETFAASTPPPAVRRLASLLAEWESDLRDGTAHLAETMEAAQQEIDKAGPEIDPELDTLLEAYVARHCPGNPASCFSPEGEAVVLEADPELLRRSSSHTAVNLLRTRMRAMLLGIVEQQTARGVWPEEAVLDKAASQLESWGFQIVRVPYLRGGKQPSVSYADSLLIDQKLFVPTLGLRRFEERTFSQLRRDLVGRYQVIPVDARTALTLRGGVHSAFGVFRQVAP